MKDEIKEILDNQKLINVENDYERIIFEYLANNCSEFDDEHIKQLVNLKVEQYKHSLDYITNLQTIEQQYSAILSENAELENKLKETTELCSKHFVKTQTLKEENERLNNIINKTTKLLKQAGSYDEETKQFCDDVWEELTDILNTLEGSNK